MTRQISAIAASRLTLAALLCASAHMARATDAPALLAVDLSAGDSNLIESDTAVSMSAQASDAAPSFTSLASPLPATSLPAKPVPQPPFDKAQPKPARASDEPLPTPAAQPNPSPVTVSTATAVVPDPAAPVATLTSGAGAPVEKVEDPAAPAPAPAAGEAESLRDAIIASLKSNPDIQIALAQQDDAKYAIGQARAGYMPRVDMTVGYGPELARTTTASTRRNRMEGSVTLSQNLWDWGVTINDIKRARASYRAAQWATREQIEAISFDITNAYLGMLQQQKLIDLTNGEIAATRKILRMVTVQKELGLTTQADVDRAKARVENVQSTLLDRQSAMQQARDAYKRLTDHIPGLAVDLPPSVNALPATVEAAVDMIDDHSPRMAQAVEDRRSLDRQYASQTGTFLPRFGLQVQGNHKYDVLGATGMAEDARAMVTMSYSFLSGGSDVALRNRIGARLRQADYELDRRRREVEQDIRADFQSLGAARQKIATINAEIDSAQRVADLYKQQFREGKRSVFDLLDSQQVLFSARANAVGNQIAMNLAEYRVLQKLGGLFDLVSAGEPLPPLVVPAPAPTRAKLSAK